MPIIQEFIGEIDGVIINDANLYYTLEDIMFTIEKKFNMRNPELTKDLYDSIDKVYFEYDTSIGDLQEDVYCCLSKANNFKDIQFEIFGNIEDMKDLNKKIKDGVYENSKESTIE